MKQEKRTFQGFHSEETFDRESFLSPPLAYAPVYTWMWNAPVSREETEKQLLEMQRLGIRRFYILPMPKTFRPTSFPTPLEPSYLSEGYLDAYQYAIERAKALGMQAWLYDEGGWPSGSACGQVMLEDPSLVAETIKVTEKQVRKGERYLPDPDVEAAFLHENPILTEQTFQEDGTLTEYRRVRTSFPHVSSADLPDITKPGATERFLKITHEKYAKRFPSLLAHGLTALFTDEPTAPRPFPYTDEIKALFRERFGEEIEGYLPVLMGKAKTTEKSAKIKIEFFDLLSRLFCERFLDKEKEWANAHGLAFLGHMDKDDEANGSMTGGSFGLLRALRRLDVPGVDAIRRQIFPKKGKCGLCDNKFFPRLASSAAAQTGGRHALSESFAVYGCGLTYDEMRFVLNFQAMRGINVFNAMVFPYGRKGYLQAGLLPHFTEDTHPDLAGFNRYAERLSYLFSLGERVADTILYAPFADGVIGEGFEQTAAAYENMGKELEKAHILFDIADDDFLEHAKQEALSRGMLAMGKAAYKTIVIPPCRYLSDKSVQILRAFAKGGGKVWTPSIEIAKRIGVAWAQDPLPSSAPYVETDGKEISYAVSNLQNGRVEFWMNEGSAPCSLSLQLRDFAPYLLSPEDGTIRRPIIRDGKIKLNLCSGEIAALLYAESESDASFTLPDQVITLDRLSFRKTERLVIAESTMRLTLDEAEQPVSLPSREALFPEDFSGKAEYRASFSLPKGSTRAVIDLGDVAGSARITINGKDIGTRLMPPYLFEIPSSLLLEQNTLVVRVTNTPANEFEHTDAFLPFREWQLGNYRKEEGAFHRDSFEGGLVNAIKIFYE